MATSIVFSLISVALWSLGSPKPQYPPNYGTNPFRNAPQPSPVQGTYSFTDPNGVRRTVSYTGDSVSGFNIVEQPQTTKEDQTEKPQDGSTNGTSTTTMSPDNKEKKDPSKDQSKIQYIPIPVYPPPYNPPPPPSFYPYSPNPYRLSYRYPSFG